MNRKNGYRALFYTMGMLILALGLTLNTKAGLGVSPVMSVPYCISEIWQWNFGDTTLVIYCLFVGLQFLLRGKKARVYDLLQLPLSLVFTRLLNVYGAAICLPLDALWQRVLVLLVSILLTGIGVAMTLDMKLVPNPCDGMVQTLGELWGKEVGLTKNLFDLCNLTITFLLGLATGHLMLGIGLGTVLGMLGVGRIIALFNRLFRVKLQRLAGLED